MHEYEPWRAHFTRSRSVYVTRVGSPGMYVSWGRARARSRAEWYERSGWCRRTKSEIRYPTPREEHAVELEARTLYEPVGLAIDRLRPCEQVKYDPKGSTSLSWNRGSPAPDAWLRRPGGSPADVALKARWKRLLGDLTSGPAIDQGAH